MKYFLLPLALTLFSSPLVAKGESKAEKTDKVGKVETTLQWQSFNQAMKTVGASGKYVFIDVYTDWCGYCKQLDATTLKSYSVVAELSRNFISVKLNAESSEQVIWKGVKMTAQELSAQWGVEGFPTLIFLNSKGDIVGSFASFAEPETMIKLLTYISSGARERKIPFDDFIKGES